MTARILVVDDILPNVKLLEAKLTAEYFEVYDGQRRPVGAELRPMAETPDIILLDVMMPGMDGFEVCQRLKAAPKTRHIPVVMVTALSDVSTTGCAAWRPAPTTFLSKPVNDVALFARVRSLARLKLMMDELQGAPGDHGQGGPISRRSPERRGRSATAGPSVLLVESSEFRRRKKIAGSPRKMPGHRSTGCQTVAPRVSKTKADGALRPDHRRPRHRTARTACALLPVALPGATRHVPILLVLDDIDLPRAGQGPRSRRHRLSDQADRPQRVAGPGAHPDPPPALSRASCEACCTTACHMAYTDPLTGSTIGATEVPTWSARFIEIVGSSAKPLSLLMVRHRPLQEGQRHPLAMRRATRCCGSWPSRVRDSVRDFDMVARYGGEEFVVVMPDSAARRRQPGGGAPALPAHIAHRGFRHRPKIGDSRCR